MIAPQRLYKASSESLPELRDLFNEHPFLRYRGPETVRHALRALRGIETDVFVVETAMEALTIEDEVLG